MELKECIKCKKKSSYFRETTKDYRCGQCGEVFILENDSEPREKSAIEDVKKILIPEDEAKEEWKKYNALLKTRSDRHLKIMKDSFYHAKEGRALINIFEVMKKAGLNEKNEPTLAISRADIHQVIFKKRDTGSGTFEMEEGWNRKGFNTDVELPQEVFNVQWPRETKSDGSQDRWRIDKERIKAKVPIIPAELMPEGDLKNFYVLWEVQEWSELPEPKDPFLLKRISQNMFVILGAWDLTELEIAIMDGMK